jgi:hypothetical protein
MAGTALRSKGGWPMTEVLEQLREQANSIERASGVLTGETEAFLAFADQNALFVAHFATIWQVMMHRFSTGGVPAKRFIDECDVLLTLLVAPARFLEQIAQVWRERNLPQEVAEPIHAKVKSARSQLESLRQRIGEIIARVATPPRVSADPEELKRCIKQADEGHEWLPLRDAIATMRRTSPSK